MTARYNPRRDPALWEDERADAMGGMRVIVYVLAALVLFAVGLLVGPVLGWVL